MFVLRKKKKKIVCMYVYMHLLQYNGFICMVWRDFGGMIGKGTDLTMNPWVLDCGYCLSALLLSVRLLRKPGRVKNDLHENPWFRILVSFLFARLLNLCLSCNPRG